MSSQTHISKKCLHFINQTGIFKYQKFYKQEKTTFILNNPKGTEVYEGNLWPP